MESREDILSETLTLMCGMMVMLGITYEEGGIIFRAGAFLIEKIDRNPEVDTNFLAEAAKRLVGEELARKQEGH